MNCYMVQVIFVYLRLIFPFVAIFNDRRRSEKTCWFCLSCPNVELHLVLSIGESYYCALAKGPLVENHVLLVPIEHCPNTLMMSSEAEAELGRYKSALNLYFKNQEKSVVYFEWVFQHSPHANLQVGMVLHHKILVLLDVYTSPNIK